VTRALFTLFKIECLQLLRTSEAYTFVLLPAVLFTPMVIGVFVLIVALVDRTVVAVPAEPIEIQLVEPLEDVFDIVEAEDPAAEVRAGRADAAVVTWKVLDPPEPVWLDVEIVASSKVTANRLRIEIRSVVADALDAKIIAAGGVPELTSSFARVQASEPMSADLRALSWIFLLFLATINGYFLIPARIADERARGLLEVLAATRTPLAAVLGMRVFVATAFCTLAAILPFIGLWILGLAELLDMDFRLLDFQEALAFLLLVNSCTMAIGLLASSTRTALYNASYAWVFGPLLLLTSQATSGPLKFAGDTSIASQLGRTAVFLLLAGAVLGGMHLLARHERVLPASGGAE